MEIALTGTAGTPSPTLPDTSAYLVFSKVDAVEETERGVLAHLHGEQLRIELVRDDVVRLKMSRAGRFDESPTYAVCTDPLSAPVDFTVEREPGVVRLRTSGLVLTLGLEPFRVDVHRPDGSPVIETAEDESGRPVAYATLNDAFTVRRRCRQEDAFYGLGEKSGGLDRKGRDFTLWNTDVLNPTAAGEFTAGRGAADPRADRTSTEFDPYYVSIPFFYHHHYPARLMAGSFVDNGYRAHYDFTPSEAYSFTFLGGQWTEYVFAGPSMREILSAYTGLTGRTQPPPLWSLGYHQCRWYDYDQAAVEALAERHRHDGVPCDALWLDIDYMDGYRVFTWDRQKFPDAPGMLQRLRSKGFRVITIIDPGVKHDPGYPVFEEGLREGHFCRTEGGDVYIGQVWPGNTAFPDFTQEETRAWWGRLNAAHVQSGLAGIWNDMNEPATGDISPLPMRFEGGRSSHERFHNQYALLMAMGTTAGLLEAMPDRRTFVLSRAGFAGIQRYAANWMGDNMSRWDHLWLSIPMAAGFGISGQAFVGADVGGFAGGSNAELFLRWMQYGALTPFFRNHSATGNVDQYVWAFGDVVQELATEAVRLRYRLLPYIYAAFLTAAETGLPVQRPLVLDFQDDDTVRGIDDAYLFGPDLLVAPVLAAGQTSRQVYLPEGSWHDFATGEVLQGRRFVLAATPMERIPLYVRGGAVVPMWTEAPASTDGFFPRALELHVFVPLEDGSWTSFVQEDDGVTFAARDGARLRTTLTLTRSGRSVELAATVVGEGYPEHRREELHVVLHGAAAGRVAVDGTAVEPSDERWVLPNSGTGFLLEAELLG
ncbi:alpha-glucosidase [Motilibacter rhizosphaerae]|uniref:Alpha-glucosidase n=1 Tax=Motilibacter rhizosphaerae TaxID=598652 RepID=A0A4Q7NGI3_9ACTN|nr:TIM-barrel domain-containing protein [Motilibacter rhizosphaerae]RZS82919.1 alpha-glucosidase [Motilibacter rhizosphaerae]